VLNEHEKSRYKGGLGNLDYIKAPLDSSTDDFSAMHFSIAYSKGNNIWAWLYSSFD
jgi:hypothetical protein